jgi:hypothetical protein
LSSVYTPVRWPVDSPLEASCRREDLGVYTPPGVREHNQVPYRHCRCGIYAVTGREELDSETRVVLSSRHVETVISGEIEGWGRVVIGTKGWRAQYARVRALFHPRDSHEEERVYQTADRYRVPVVMRS